MASSSSWMPAHGAHQVNIGASLRRALKARKNNGKQQAPAPTKRPPDRDFYAFRYNFKPSSIDSEKPGNIDIRKTSDSTAITVEYPSKQSGEKHVFRGSENVAKEWDCVLVYDEELGIFTLEKLDSHAALTHERKVIAGRPPPPPSPKPPPQIKVEDDLGAQLEKDLLDLATPDADGEGELEVVIPKSVAYCKEEEEEDPIEELISPPPPLPKQPPPPRQKASAKASMKPPQPQRAEKPMPKSKGKAPAFPHPPSSTIPANPPSAPATKPLPPKPKLKPTPVPVPVPVPAPAPVAVPISALVPAPAPPAVLLQTKAPKKRGTEPAHLSDADEEVLEFGKPAKRPRKLVPTPALAPPSAPVISGGLALPGTSSSVAPPPPVHSAPSSASSSSSSGPPLTTAVSQHSVYASSPALPVGAGEESESEGEWDEVDPETTIQDDDFFGDGMVGMNEGDEEEQGEDIDEDELKAQMEQMLEMEEEEEAPRGPPISLNDYAKEMVGEMGLSDDDTSTSEESDED